MITPIKNKILTRILNSELENEKKIFLQNFIEKQEGAGLVSLLSAFNEDPGTIGLFYKFLSSTKSDGLDFQNLSEDDLEEILSGLLEGTK